MFNDEIVESGQAFMGEGITEDTTPPLGTGYANVQIWNPWGSGKRVYLDQYMVTGNAPGRAENIQVFADLRRARVALTTIFPDHTENKLPGGPASVAEMRTSVTIPPEVYPFDRPKKENWIGVTNKDSHPYRLDPPLIIPQGGGVVIGIAGDINLGGISKGVVSWEWREKADPAGVLTEPPFVLIAGNVGTITSNTADAAHAFDSNASTFAYLEAPTFYIGKIFSTPTLVRKFEMKSPADRSLSGANPGRSPDWAYQTFNGSTWKTRISGNLAEGSSSIQSVISGLVWEETLGARLAITNSSTASHRVMSLDLYS